jgi:hypothetical protein
MGVHYIQLTSPIFDHSDNTDDEWQQAEALMANYKAMLEKREGLYSEVRGLEEQNDVLGDRLRARLDDEVNEELAFPPSDMISVDNEG